MTYREILQIAMNQSAEDIGCRADDFLSAENVSVSFRMGPNARKYLQPPISCALVSYGNNVVAASEDGLSDLVSEYVGRFTFYRCFETPHLLWLNERLASRGHKICFMSEYYLPNVNAIPDLPCAYETRVLEPPDFEPLYLPAWSNALCAERRQLDVLGIGAYEDGRLVGLAGCSVAVYVIVGVDLYTSVAGRKGFPGSLAKAGHQHHNTCKSASCHKHRYS